MFIVAFVPTQRENSTEVMAQNSRPTTHREKKEKERESGRGRGGAGYRRMCSGNSSNDAFPKINFAVSPWRIQLSRLETGSPRRVASHRVALSSQ